jgi:Tol biopolymer transport system component
MPTLAGAIVSRPMTQIASAGASAAPSFSVMSGPTVVYVSLLPGTMPRGVRGTISNTRTASQVNLAIANGGFDPVAVAAGAGDTLGLEIEVSDGGPPLRFALPVLATRPPVVVRTEPPHKKRDVALNATIVVVFSAPINPATLTATSVQLLSGTGPVTGRLEFRDAAHITAELIPRAPLTPGSTYELMVTQEIRDLDGQPLDTLVTVSFVTVSPGVSQIAFTSSRNGTTDIFLLNGDSAGIRALTKDSAVESNLRWSPDGKKLAFTSYLPGSPFGSFSIYVVNADGSRLTRLTNALAGVGSSPSSPSWSPDGTRIAYSDGLYIYAMNADGSAVTKLSTGLGPFDSPAWSPRDRRIAFHSRGNEGLYVMNADGTGVSMVANVLTSSFAWSPDGTRIGFIGGAAFVGGGGDERVLCVVNADGSGLAALTAVDPTAYQPNPVWSPDGTKIAFSRTTGLYAINTDGSGLVTLTNAGTALTPGWSPDGTQIAFIKSGKSGAGPYLLYLMKADGSGVRQLVVDNVSWPAWNPTGSSMR